MPTCEFTLKSEFLLLFPKQTLIFAGVITLFRVKIKDVVATLERFAPLPLQDSYDNAGLQVGLTEAEVSGVLLCLDVTEQVLTEAVNIGANLVVAHHPLLFRPLSCLSDCDMPQRCARMAVQHDITIYAAHTNLDNAHGGVNFKIAEKLGLEVNGFLQPANDVSGSGIIGTFSTPMVAEDFLLLVRNTFGVECLMHNEPLHRPIRTVALCGGAGDFLLKNAIAARADAFITGEMHYHTYFGHEQEIQIAVTGHYQSEKFTVEIFQALLAQDFPTLKVRTTTVNTNPIKYL